MKPHHNPLPPASMSNTGVRLTGGVNNKCVYRALGEKYIHSCVCFFSPSTAVCCSHNSSVVQAFAENTAFVSTVLDCMLNWCAMFSLFGCFFSARAMNNKDLPQIFCSVFNTNNIIKIISAVFALTFQPQHKSEAGGRSQDLNNIKQ